MTEIPCEYADDMTEAQIIEYRILDNEIAMMGYNDTDKFLAEAAKIPDFDFAEFGVELPDPVEKINEGECDDDESPEIKIDASTKRGDIWILGEHRLMCGDSTMIDDVTKLMNERLAAMVFTDPPYNTGMKEKNGSTWLSHMFKDSYSPDEWQTFMSSFMSSYWMILKEDAVAYICLDWRRNHELVTHIESAGFKRSNLIVWDKMVHGLGSDYKYTYELINVCKKGNPELETHQGDDREYSDVWHIQRKMGKNEDHATAKPVEIMERAIRHASKTNQIVADFFGGSGSTLIACEKTNRKCFMMEIAPNYCDVIIKRWQNFSGKEAVLESNGKKFNEFSTLV